MVARRWPAVGKSHVSGRRNAFSQRSLSNMQIARLALFEVNKKMRGRCTATKGFRHEEGQPWAAPMGMSAPIVWEAWFEDSWICCCCCASSFASLDFPASVTRLTGLDYSGEKILTADLDPGRDRRREVRRGRGRSFQPKKRTLKIKTPRLLKFDSDTAG
jgi:hypothetical protein